MTTVHGDRIQVWVTNCYNNKEVTIKTLYNKPDLCLARDTIVFVNELIYAILVDFKKSMRTEFSYW